MTPQDLFWNSWFGLSMIGVAVLATLIAAVLTIAFLRRRLRVTVAWIPPTKIGT